MDKVEVFGVNIMSVRLAALLETLDEGVVFTPNVDHIVKLDDDPEFQDAYNQADWVLCDSNILSLGAKFLGKPIAQVIPGSSLLPAFYDFHKHNKKIRIFLLGAAEGVATKAKKNINAKVGWEMVVGVHSPSFGFESSESECEDILEIINSSSANVLVVGLGAPKQEKWIVKFRHRLHNIDLFMALGATIDFEAGNIKRAPLFFQKLYLEWLYRLAMEPQRLWRRYLIEGTYFFYLLFREKFRKKSA